MGERIVFLILQGQADWLHSRPAIGAAITWCFEVYVLGIEAEWAMIAVFSAPRIVGNYDTAI